MNNNIVLPLISIVVPVYNVEKFLSHCIDSILNQSYKNIELILVDDGSRDHSGKICDDYAKKDKRVKVYHKKNGGVSSARNYGMINAHGQYITFIDSDDWISKNFLENFRVEEIQADLYISGALYDIEGKLYSKKKYSEQYADNIDDIAKCFFSQNLKDNGYPWGKLFLLDIIQSNGIFFDEKLSINEDHIFIFWYFCYIHSLYVTSTADYHYLVIDNSGRKLSSKINSRNEIVLANVAFQNLVESLSQKWHLDSVDKERLKSDYVYEHRLRALRASLLLKDYKSFIKETIFWKKCNYKPKARLFQFMLCIIRKSNSSRISYILLSFLIFFRNTLKTKNIMQDIYNDLESRSVVIK